MLPNSSLAVGHFSSTDGPACTRTSFRAFIRLFCRCCWISTSTQEKPVQMSLSFKKSIFRISGIPGFSISFSCLVFVACNSLSLFSFFVTPRLRPGDSPSDSPSDAPSEVPDASPGEVPGDSTGCAPAALPSRDFTFLMSFTSLHPPGVIVHFSSLYFGFCPRVNHVALNNVHCRSGIRFIIP